MKGEGVHMNNNPGVETAGTIAPPPTLPPKTWITLKVNGTERRLEIAPWTILLDALRDRLDLTGTKKGCDHGQCGACTVLMGSKPVHAGLTLAIMHDGADITTIEFIAKVDALHPVQQAF